MPMHGRVVLGSIVMAVATLAAAAALHLEKDEEYSRRTVDRIRHKATAAP